MAANKSASKSQVQTGSKVPAKGVGKMGQDWYALFGARFNHEGLRYRVKGSAQKPVITAMAGKTEQIKTPSADLLASAKACILECTKAVQDELAAMVAHKAKAPKQAQGAQQ